MNYLIQTLYYLNNIETGIPVTELLFLRHSTLPVQCIQRFLHRYIYTLFLAVYRRRPQQRHYNCQSNSNSAYYFILTNYQYDLTLNYPNDKREYYGNAYLRPLGTHLEIPCSHPMPDIKPQKHQ